MRSRSWSGPSSPCSSGGRTSTPAPGPWLPASGPGGRARPRPRSGGVLRWPDVMNPDARVAPPRAPRVDVLGQVYRRPGGHRRRGPARAPPRSRSGPGRGRLLRDLRVGPPLMIEGWGRTRDRRRSRVHRRVVAAVGDGVTPAGPPVTPWCADRRRGAGSAAGVARANRRSANVAPSPSTANVGGAFARYVLTNARSLWPCRPGCLPGWRRWPSRSRWRCTASPVRDRAGRHGHGLRRRPDRCPHHRSTGGQGHRTGDRGRAGSSGAGAWPPTWARPRCSTPPSSNLPPVGARTAVPSGR